MLGLGLVVLAVVAVVLYMLERNSKTAADVSAVENDVKNVVANTVATVEKSANTVSTVSNTANTASK
jgi:hypothetical protein